jgi:hypothetical protein
VVVHDIENDSQAVAVRRIHEGARVIRCAVVMKGCEEEHAVIAPPEAPVELRDRHHFERRDPERREMRQPFTRRRPRPAGRERTDVHFVDDLAVTRLRASPPARRPRERVRIDDHRGPEGTVRLKA